jgi:predicted outer membrane protein
MGWTKSGFGIAGVALLLAGCSTGGERPVPTRPPMSVDRGLSSADYLEQAASLDLLEVRTSQLAFTRSGNARVRNYARMMIDEHTGLAAQLSFAGRRLGLLPSATLLPRHQAMLDGLGASPDFDRSYRSQQGELHRVAWQLHSEYAARGSSPTLRPVAASAVTVERRHLAMLQSL